MRVLLACSDASASDGFLDALQRADIAAVSVGDAATTIELARQQRPDIVLFDDELPGMSVAAGLPKLAAESPDSEVMVLAGRFDRGSGVRVILEGAAGYISRGTAPEALPRIVHGVMPGEAAIPRILTTALIERLRLLPRSEAGRRPTTGPLSSREWEVLDLMATGASPREISTELVVPLETVLGHEQHILGKLGIHSRRRRS
jgi:DNA-binding NarL/FixJ family response regulator